MLRVIRSCVSRFAGLDWYGEIEGTKSRVLDLETRAMELAEENAGLRERVEELSSRLDGLCLDFRGMASPSA